MRKLAGVMLATAVFALYAIPASAAFEAYIKVTGQTQGGLKGETTQHQVGQQPALEFTYAVQSARDVTTGQSAGRRSHKPVTFLSQSGSASPQPGHAELPCRALVVTVSFAGGPAASAVPVARGGPGNACWYRVSLPGPKAVQAHVWLTAPGTDFAVTGNSILVDFVEGDPDKPIVIGALFNGRDPSGRFRLGFTHSALPPPAYAPPRVK